MPKRALITGITGQDGTYLTKLLLEKGYQVYGLTRHDPSEGGPIKLLTGCLKDTESIERALGISRPDEIYNLGAQASVGFSFQIPEETWNINYLGLVRLVLTAVKLNPEVKIFQASSAEMFGTTPPPQSESSPFNPVSPYAKAKAAAHEDIVVKYRERHGLFICSGILFNHESPRRGLHFVTRKITHSLAKIKLGLQDCLELGNLQAKRDWGFAGDYVEAMWLMLQRDKPKDFIIATGTSRTVEEFVELAAHFLDMNIMWSGGGPDQIGQTVRENKTIVTVNSSFLRPNEVNHLLGDASKARRELGWEPKMSFRNLVAMMANADLELVRKSMP